jgi:hypothetical protein
MKNRTLLDGTQVKEYSDPVAITVYTKAPGKWRLIDMETGQQYAADSVPAKANILDMIKIGRIKNVSNYTHGTWVKIEKAS